MRMRFKPYAGPELAACPFHMNDATRYKGRWRETFARPGQPLHLELGCGKGGFLARLASRNPDVNYIGVDITDKVLILAKRNIERIYAEQGLPIDNVKTLAHDIERIPTLLDKADRVERIYINFCNPWPTARHHKRRASRTTSWNKTANPPSRTGWPGEGGFARFITKAYDSSRTPRMGTRSYQPIRRQKRIRLSIVSARSLLLRGFASRKGTATRLMLNTADTPIP